MTGSQDANQSQDAHSNSERSGREFHRERLSAMVDGMLSADEARFLLRRMAHDDELADCWQRWQWYGDAMRGQAGRALPADFAQRVGRAIADDQAKPQPEVASARGASRRPFLLWGGGGALAASVALAALLAPRWLTPQAPAPDSAQPAVAAVAPAQNLPIPLPAAQASLPVMLSQTAPPATTVAVAAVEESRPVKPHFMAGARALASGDSPHAAKSPAARHPSGELAAAAHDTHVASKPWPTALVPGVGQSGSIVDYRIDVGPAPSFAQGLEPPAGESQSQPSPESPAQPASPDIAP